MTEIPEILTLVSKEKFRRRWIVVSRVIAIFLVFALFYWGYIYSQYGKNVQERPCWSCGYYYGKMCTPNYVNSMLFHNNSEREGYIRSIADYNELPVNATINRDPRLQNINISFLNISS